MKKIYIVSIGYTRFATDSKESAFTILEAQIVEREYVGGEYIYMPKVVKDSDIVIIDESNLRVMTIEEKETKELSDAKSSEKWAKDQAEKFRKENEDLKCQIKALTKKED